MIVVCPLASIALTALLVVGAKHSAQAAPWLVNATASTPATSAQPAGLNGEIRETTMISSALVGLVSLIVIGATISGSSIRTRLVQEVRRRRSLERTTVGLQRFVETMPQIGWITDANGALMYLSDRWFHYTGQDPIKVVAYDWSAFVHPDDVAASLATWESSLRTGIVYEVAFRLRSASGEYHLFIDRGIPDRDGDGTIVRWVGSCTDIDLVHAQRGSSRRRLK